MKLEIEDLKRAYKWLSALYYNVDYFADETGLYKIKRLDKVKVTLEIEGDIERMEIQE